MSTDRVNELVDYGEHERYARRAAYHEAIGTRVDYPREVWREAHRYNVAWPTLEVMCRRHGTTPWNVDSRTYYPIIHDIASEYWHQWQQQRARYA